MKRKTLLSFLILGTVLLTSAYASQPIIEDPSPINFIQGWQIARYEYRDYGSVNVFLKNTNTSGFDSSGGAYFMFDSAIKPGGFLNNLEDIVNVEVTHSTGKVFNLLNFIRLWPSLDLISEWYLFLQPEDWMFEGSWTFTLIYEGTDSRLHRQAFIYDMPPLAFPSKISHVRVDKNSDSYQVSWSGFGKPIDSGSPFNYRVRVFDSLSLDCFEDYRTDKTSDSTNYWRYDDSTNRINFKIPVNYAGEYFFIRLENRLQRSGRTCYYLRLP
jgi:hypothetical protein